jgi:hypothetical protein
MSTEPYTSRHPPVSRTSEPEGSSPLFAFACVLLGFLVVVLAFVAAFMWFDAHDARDAANRAADRATAATGGHAMPGAATNLGSLESYAGASPANAE